MNTSFLLRPLCLGSALTAAVLSVSSAHASMGNIATTYGLLPQDMATSQSFSLFSDQVSASYYNPASLALSERGELTFGFLQATPSLEVTSNGGANPPQRSGTVLESNQTETVLFGMKTNLTSLTKFKTPVYLALMAGVEKYGLEMLAFESNSSQEGQFMQYGQKPLFLSVSAAANVMPGFHLGAGVRVTLHAKANMVLESDLAGNTNSEELEVNAEPVFIPLIGAYFDVDELLCGDAKDCLWQGLDLAISYRGESDTQTKVNANATIPGTIPDPGLPLVVNTLDAYQPMIISIGARYQLTPSWQLATTIEYQNWAELENKLKDDTIKDQASLTFSDAIVPRFGARYEYSNNTHLLMGLSYEESVLDDGLSPDVNVFDNDRFILGAGISHVYGDTKFLAFPLRVDAAYQYHHLVERDFVLSSDEVVTSPYESVTASGNAHVVSLSFSMMF
ncbi:OmpP1/FadL family transporter [Bermanella sp. WJH001]|uniref:OmpP1/FadL family transporter n=1 Tax=Bermanella sp. WJH001 TaxID=3048005 RepID=UPI0024BD9973|nr:outer membrane protein transport protein [Bermanella sp. WJH001]MDJ1537272.1 outer membrane protein transport protein [Bermanella sp. WJH001]